MAQIKIYGLKSTLNPIKAQLSDVIHGCVVEALKFPAGGILVSLSVSTVEARCTLTPKPLSLRARGTGLKKRIIRGTLKDTA
jgi:hypothetical protein